MPYNQLFGSVIDKWSNRMKLNKAAIFVDIAAFAISGIASADMTIATVATTVTSNFAALAKLITATAYIAGLGFSIGAILKFKQHKDNPTQIPIGTPIAMLFIAAALIFLPTIFGITGQTLFGSDKEAGGPSGVVPLQSKK